MWWDVYKQSKTHIFNASFKDPIIREERFTDCDRGVLLIMAIVITPVLVVAAMVVGFAS